MPAQCQSCQKLISTDADNRLPPWCPHCGGDIKRVNAPAPAPAAPPAAAAAVEATVETVGSCVRPYEAAPAPLTWREPELAECSGELALAAACDDRPARPAEYARREEAARRSSSRWAGLGMLGGGVLCIAVVVGLNVLVSANGHIVIPLKLSYLGVALTLVGGYTLFAGRDVTNIRAKSLYEVTVGPDGISRSLVDEVGPSALSEGWSIPWGAMDRVAWVENPLLGPGAHPTLEVRTRSGDVERVVVAPHIRREQLAALTAAHGKTLDVAQAGDWKR